MPPWIDILPEDTPMLFGVLSSDDIIKLVAAIGVIITIVLQQINSKKLAAKHDNTQEVLNVLIGVLTQNRRTGDPKPGPTLLTTAPATTIITPPPSPTPIIVPPTPPQP